MINCPVWISFKNLKVRSEYRALTLEYFGDVAKHINWMLSNTKSITLTCNVYTLAGSLVKHCGSLIYVKVLIVHLLGYLDVQRNLTMLQESRSPGRLDDSHKNCTNKVASLFMQYFICPMFQCFDVTKLIQITAIVWLLLELFLSRTI